MTGKPLGLLPYLLIAAIMIGGYVWHLGTLKGALPAPSTVEVAPPDIGGPFSLVDQDGKRRTDKDFRGRFTLVFFGYTYCPDVCPTTLAVISSALDKMGPNADRVVPIFISVDPKCDTPEVLKSYLSAFGTRFVGLTGTDKDVAVAAKDYKVYYKVHPEADGNYSLDHSNVIYLMNPKGQFVANYTLETGPDAMAKDLNKRVSAAS